MKTRWVRAVAVVGGTVVLVAGSPAFGQVRMPQMGNGRQDFLAATGCNTRHLTSSYALEADAIISMQERHAEVSHLSWAYLGEDPVEPDNIPKVAKNNITIKVMTADGKQTLISWDSPDDQQYLRGDFRRFYDMAPHWNISTDPGAVRIIRFSPDFDKRDVEPDPTCNADTPPFHGAEAAHVDVD